MKDISIFLNESRSFPEDIKNYGESWCTQYAPKAMGNVIKWFAEGVKQYLEDAKDFDNTQFDNKYIEGCEKCINQLLETIEKEKLFNKSW